MHQTNRRKTTAPPAHPFHKSQCQTAELRLNSPPSGSASRRSGGRLLRSPQNRVNRFFAAFFASFSPPSNRPKAASHQRRPSDFPGRKRRAKTRTTAVPLPDFPRRRLVFSAAPSHREAAYTSAPRTLSTHLLQKNYMTLAHPHGAPHMREQDAARS